MRAAAGATHRTRAYARHVIDELTGRAAPLRMRPRLLVAPDPARPHAAPPGTEAVVVGGGIAGTSAAVVLAERGVAVTLLEAAPTLGGRLGAWPHTLPDGTDQVVEHGFHAFFRHYYTWRSLLRRIDPALSFLRPVGGYPVISRTWPPEDLTGLPAAPPLNLVALFARSRSLGMRDLLGSDSALASELLAYDREHTTARFDDMPAAEFLAGLGMSDRAQAMLFEAFARSFFCNQSGLSAAELVAMFHYYFLGNPEGIGFDAPDTDYLTCIWAPFARYLDARGAQVRTGTAARSVSPAEHHRWRVDLADGTSLETRHLVLATEPGALRDLLAASPEAAAAAPRLAGKAAALTVAPPFAVTRLWYDRDVAPERPTFSAVSREPTLDSITVYSRLERPSAQWARRTGGSVVELHSYSCSAPDVDSATARMRAELAALWPETADAGVVHLQQRLEATAPAFPPGGAGTRPAVHGEARGVRVAGDYVEVPYLSGLMERASMSGVLAANDVLAEVGAGPEEIRGVPQRGLLAGLVPGRSRRRAGAVAASL
jgi:isorenieratene synthase